MTPVARQATADDDTIRVGMLLGRKYRIDACIGEGGMSFIYRARDMSLDEQVAIKVLRPELRAENDAIARFLREAKTIRRIKSDHCVNVLEVDLDPEHGPFMVMELLEGTTLRDILEASPRLAPWRACELVIQVCDALAAAHMNQCIHRDIKPENVFVVRRGDLEVARLLDFGISKHALTGLVLNQDLAQVRTMSLMGTPMYMSPEQMRSSAKTDERTDIWAVGVMLYEMLGGRPAFYSESVTEIASMVATEDPAPLQVVEPTVPHELAEVVHRCLRKRPDERYSNVGQLAVELLRFAPRRARGCVERIISALASVGVDVDVSTLGELPPPSPASFPASIPASGRMPRLHSDRDVPTRAALDSGAHVTPENATLTSLVRSKSTLRMPGRPSSERGLRVALAVAGALVLAAIGLFVFALRPHGKPATELAAMEGFSSTSNAGFVLPAATAQPVIAVPAVVETAASAAPSPSVEPSAPATPRRTAPPRFAPVSGKPPAASAAASVAPKAPPAASTSHVRIVDP